MPPKRHTVGQILAKLRKPNFTVDKGKKLPAICKPLEITEQAHYRCWQTFGLIKP